MSRTLHLFGTDWCAMMVPIQVIRWYRMQCYDGTDSCAIVVPIRRYCHLVNILSACYVKRNLLYLENWMHREGILNNEDDLIAKINEPEFVAGLDSILLKYRITNMKSHLHQKDKVKDYIVNHQTHLLQHISRIYRLRNELVHEAALKQDIENVASNLRFYLVFVLNQMVDYFSEDTTNMKSKTMLQFFWNYEKGLRTILSADSSEVVSVILDIHIAKSYIV